MAFYIGQVSEHAVIFNGEGRILLLVHGGEYSGKSHLPGGRMDIGDQPGQGLLREIEEETGLTDVELIVPCSTSRWGAMEPTKYSVAYLARVEGVPDIVLPEHEAHEGYEWVTPEEAVEREFIFAEMNAVVADVIAWAKRLKVI
ncbi:MAG TPA: NUDIX hydrolase [Alphaproteobacteria bacterium]|nr:NUDIX hydrolase [Alphaproteobacteria bacterium]